MSLSLLLFVGLYELQTEEYCRMEHWECGAGLHGGNAQHSTDAPAIV